MTLIKMKGYCRYKGIACEFATEYGYCQLTGCVKRHDRPYYMEIMCEYDEAFTIQEMLEETGQCKDCKLNCPNAGKSE